MKRYITSVIALTAALAAGAQNLNPTVEVTNQYEGKVMEVAKPVVEMEVPDSLLHFDLEFDYSVFDKPYQGSYTFNPYLMDIRPEPDAYRGRRLYVKAGAGYALRPTLDAVWSPALSGPVSLNVYANHYSYIGQYKVRLGDYRNDFNGYDSKTRAGVDGRYAFNGGTLTFGAGYYGIHTKESTYAEEEKMGLNALDLKIGVRSLRGEESSFYYDVKAALRGGAQRFTSCDRLKFNEVSFDGTLGPVLDGQSALLFDAHVDLTSYGSLFTSQTGMMYLTPKYLWHQDRWRVSAGLRVGKTLHSDNEWDNFALGRHKSRIFYPDVRVGYEAITDRLNLYATAMGGDRLPSYTALKEDNPFYNPWFGRGEKPAVDNSAEHIRAKFGLQGNIRSKFRFDVGGGFASVEHAMLDAVRQVPSAAAAEATLFVPAVSYASYRVWFAEGTLTWDARPVLAEASLRYGKAHFKEDWYGFEPTPLSGRARVRYNWHDRIQAGIFAEGALKREGCVNFVSVGQFLLEEDPSYSVNARPVLSDLYSVDGLVVAPLSIPGWVDLGLEGEAALTRRLSVWARIGNLLNQNIQRHPLYPEGGFSLTGGIILTL